MNNEEVAELEVAVNQLCRFEHRFVLFLEQFYFTDIFEVALFLKRLKNAVARVERFKKELNKTIQKIEGDKLLNLMEYQKIQRVVYDGLGTLEIKDRFNCRINPELKEAAIEYLKDIDPSIVKETIHHSTLNARASQAIAEGDPLPPTLFEITAYPYVKLTEEKTC